MGPLEKLLLLAVLDGPDSSESVETLYELAADHCSIGDDPDYLAGELASVDPFEHGRLALGNLERRGYVEDRDSSTALGRVGLTLSGFLAARAARRFRAQ